jgi:hypothetical protein
MALLSVHSQELFAVAATYFTAAIAVTHHFWRTLSDIPGLF